VDLNCICGLSSGGNLNFRAYGLKILISAYTALCWCSHYRQSQNIDKLNELAIELIEEFKLKENSKTQLSQLLQKAFPEVNFKGRNYYKQIPQFRILLKRERKVLGQIGLDYRIMTLNDSPIKVLGVIDFAVLPTEQGKGYGTKLLLELDNIAKSNQHNIDFILLFADNSKIYTKNGYKVSDQKVKWLAIDNHINHGIFEKQLFGCLMYKKIGTMEWNNKLTLDMLGYLY